MEKDEIVFEDLHGNPEMDNVVVDLDVDDNAKGITRVADDKPEREKQRANGHDEGDADKGDEDDSKDSLRGREADGEDDGEYSKKVRNRIDRERKLRKKEQEQTSYWREQAEAAQRQLGEARKSTTKEVLEGIDAQITAAETELEAAMEAGRSADQVKTISRLTDLKAKRITTEMAGQAEADSDNRQESGKVRPSGGVNPLAKEWMSEQNDWYGKPGFERQSRLANRLDKEIFAEGYDVNDPDYYKELSRRLRRQAPEIFDDDASQRTARDRGRSPVARVDDGGNEQRVTRSSKVELDQEDFSNMRKYGLDPNNADHLKEYAANKREADAQERQRQGARS